MSIYNRKSIFFVVAVQILFYTGTVVINKKKQKMEQAEVIDFMREAIWLTIRLSAPIMIIGLVVGVIIALIQALTQIQEMTLAFVPKMLAIFLSIFALFPAMAAALQGFMELIADKIVSLG